MENLIKRTTMGTIATTTMGNIGIHTFNKWIIK
jgi:hypothetical protein